MSARDSYNGRLAGMDHSAAEVASGNQHLIPALRLRILELAMETICKMGTKQLLDVAASRELRLQWGADRHMPGNVVIEPSTE